jgi:osmotically-inducible protein OsmY
MRDEQIVKDIMDHLSWDNRVDASDIQVEVTNGKVRLFGAVPVYTTRQIAEQACYDVEGVTSVENQLQVKHPTSMTIPPDPELKAHLETLLNWNQELASESIRLEVKNGEVTLDGTVDAYWKKVRAEEMAAAVKGVLGIQNTLAVVPTESIYDDAIGDGIADALARNPQIDANTVDVQVKDGRVSLSGKVPNQGARKAAQDAAQHTMGVIEVYNQLELGT